jgi:hypothetical protein
MIMSGGNHWQGVDQVGQNLVLGKPKGKAFALRRNWSKRPSAQRYSARRGLAKTRHRHEVRRIWLVSAGGWKITIVASRLVEQFPTLARRADDAQAAVIDRCRRKIT